MAKIKKSIFFPAKSKRLARIITIKSPTAFRESIRKLRKGGITTTEKRALVLAQNRARAMLKRKDLSEKEQTQMRAIANMKLPKITKKTVKKKVVKKKRRKKSPGIGLYAF